MKTWRPVDAIAASLLCCIAIGCNSSKEGTVPGGNAAGDVTAARLASDASRGIDWLVNGRYWDQHFSPLKQITSQNVGSLGLAWYLDIDSPMGLAAEPIEVDGTIYVSGPLDRVYAVNAATGKLLWLFDPHVRMDRFRNSWADRTNRGVAVWAGKVYLGTGDCRLIALDAAIGNSVWQTTACDGTETGITGSPRVGNGKVYIGYNGSDTGVRGSVLAFDAATGQQVWRFWTVPDSPNSGPDYPALALAAKTWTGKDWWTTGGGDVWTGINYDDVTNQVIFGTAGANPEALYGDRASLKVGGKKLFSGCIIAVNADTGKMDWYYQTSPYTENMQIVVADLEIGGMKRHVAMTVPKNGIFYVLDARTGRLISSNPLNARMVTVPAAHGGGQVSAANHNWWPMSYSPLTGLVYIPASDARVPVSAGTDAREGKLYAWDPVAQTNRWTANEALPFNSGILSTAGNLVFAGQGTGEFDAYAADSGHKLWSIPTGSANDAVPISYELQGQQYVLVPVGYGSASRLFFKGSDMGTPESKRGPARLLAFRLNGPVPFPFPHVIVPTVPQPPAETFSQAHVLTGHALYQKFLCSDCHSLEADGDSAWTVNGAIPDLRYMPPSIHLQFLAVVMAGSDAANGMPCFGCGAGFPLDHTKLTVREAEDIHDYIIDQSWKAYRTEQGRHRLTSDR
jgi:quinohemoprotein ethanol dehydrogenase